MRAVEDRADVPGRPCVSERVAAAASGAREDISARRRVADDRRSARRCSSASVVVPPPPFPCSRPTRYPPAANAKARKQERPGRARLRPRALTSRSVDSAGIGIPRSSKVAAPPFPRSVCMTFQKNSACAAASTNTKGSEIARQRVVVGGQHGPAAGSAVESLDEPDAEHDHADHERRPDVDPRPASRCRAPCRTAPGAARTSPRRSAGRCSASPCGGSGRRSRACCGSPRRGQSSR